MDIKINADGRYVEVTGINESTALDYAAGIVYDLWAATEVTKDEDNEKKLTAGGSASLDKGPRPFGFAFMNAGERLEVK